MSPDDQDPTANRAPVGVASNAALLATFYVDQKKGEVARWLQDLFCEGLSLVQDRPGRWRTPHSIEAILLRFDAAHDATILQLALNPTGHAAREWGTYRQEPEAAREWEVFRQKLEDVLSPEVLSGIWGYTLTYQGALNPGAVADNVFEKVRNAVHRLYSDRGAPYKPLAEARIEGGGIWLMAVPTEGDGPAAGTIYVALSEPKKESALGKAFWAQDAELLVPDLIAHKGYFERRQYRGRRYKEYKDHLDEFRKLVRDLLNELEKREVRSAEISELTRRYHKLAEMVWWLEELRVSMTQQLHNYDRWQIADDIFQYHRRHIETTNVELELLVSEGQYALGVAEPVLSISRYRAEKAREELQRRAREDQERRWRQQEEELQQRREDEQREQQKQDEEQARRRRKIDVMVAVVAAAIAVPELLNQKATAALLEWFPPAAWLLDRLFSIQELHLDHNLTHVRVILAAQILIIAMLAVLFYWVIHRVLGEPREGASDGT